MKVNKAETRQQKNRRKKQKLSKPFLNSKAAKTLSEVVSEPQRAAYSALINTGSVTPWSYPMAMPWPLLHVHSMIADLMLVAVSMVAGRVGSERQKAALYH